ncbi:MAG: hypothetical protein JWP43_1042 [Ramlibacter sp.]|jgi:hypothetical protein|nr:hypothetical protein [Ramlibacter sp.]
MDALNGIAPEPTQEERSNVSRARALANDLFQLAMDEVAQRAKATRRA